MNAEILKDFRVGQLAILGADKDKSNYLWLDGIDRISVSEHRHIVQISLHNDEVWVSAKDDDEHTYILSIKELSDSILKEVNETLFGKALEIANKLVMVNYYEDVKITIENNTKVFNHKGIEIDRTTWEQAPCPMYCSNIDDKTMCEIVIMLFQILKDDFEEELNDYIEYKNGKEFPLERQYVLEDIDDFRWKEEEELFYKNGGIYYEDMSDEEYNRLTSK